MRSLTCEHSVCVQACRGKSVCVKGRVCENLSSSVCVCVQKGESYVVEREDENTFV